MNEQILKGKWHQVKGKAMKEWGKLTHDDLDQINGNIEILKGKLMEKYGKSLDAKKQINDFLLKLASEEEEADNQ
jgi:uncharacterized protein YjbJ (UPF0337 family)